jgi:hypothetical protein
LHCRSLVVLIKACVGNMAFSSRHVSVRRCHATRYGSVPLGGGIVILRRRSLALRLFFFVVAVVGRFRRQLLNKFDPQSAPRGSSPLIDDGRSTRLRLTPDSNENTGREPDLILFRDMGRSRNTDFASGRVQSRPGERSIDDEVDRRMRRRQLTAAAGSLLVNPRLIEERL